MPESITIDITPIKIGDKRRVSDLTIPGLKFLDSSNAVVVAVQMARAAILDEEEEETEEGAEGADGEGAEGAEGAEKATESADKAAE